MDELEQQPDCPLPAHCGPSPAPPDLPPQRVILLGASNLARSGGRVIHVLRTCCGGPVEIFAAHGHGRSYGIRSRVLVRELPGILQSGLWRALDERPPAPTAALVTDIGNDLLYEIPVPTIVDWIDECLRRLERLQARTVMTLLPLMNLESLSPGWFQFFRTLFHPHCRLPFEEVIARAHELNARLIRLAEARGVCTFEPRAEWYGIDPIHLRYRSQVAAWRLIFSTWELPSGAEATGSLHRPGSLTAVRIRVAAPEKRWILGRERSCPQPALTLPDGTTVSLY